MPPTVQTPWTTDIALRLRRHLVLKLVGISAGTAVFFMGYFYLLRHPLHAVTVMPQTALDAMIPFQPSALWAYLSLWLYVGMAPGLQLSVMALLTYGLWIAALCLSGLACFYVWPTEVAPHTFDVSDHAGFSMLQGVDAAGNACPSMHVAAAMFSVLWIGHVLRQTQSPVWLQLVNLVWFLAIVYSTLAIKQHVVLDVLAGALLGGVFGAASLRWWPRSLKQVAGGAVRVDPRG